MSLNEGVAEAARARANRRAAETAETPEPPEPPVRVWLRNLQNENEQLQLAIAELVRRIEVLEDNLGQ
jgi:hypothetical protein